MGNDSTISAIDRFFDAIDNGVETADRVLNRTKDTEGKLDGARKRSKRAAAIDVEVTEHKPDHKADHKPEHKSRPSAKAEVALTRKPHFYIVESITPTGTLFIVTDGGNARTECSTREFAEKVLRALEASS